MSYRSKRNCGNRLGVTNIIFSDANPQDNDCGCNNNGNGGGTVNPPNPGNPGSIMQEIEIAITSTNQTVFTNVIPQGKTIVGLYVDGIRQLIGKDYEINSDDITWKSNIAGFTLDSSLTLTITVQ